MQRLCEARRVITQNIVFLVPEYDGSKVRRPRPPSCCFSLLFTPFSPLPRALNVGEQCLCVMLTRVSRVLRRRVRPCSMPGLAGLH